ncbi:hypothetical protein MCEMRE196_00213 [Candidatus Nanopelagicaceae bacterium]
MVKHLRPNVEISCLKKFIKFNVIPGSGLWHHFCMRKCLLIAVVLLSQMLTLSAFAEITSGANGIKVPSPSKDQFLLTFNQSSTGATNERYSHKVTDPDLNNPGRSLPHYLAVLPPCKNLSDVTCIESIESRKSGNLEWSKGTLSEQQLDVNKLDVSKVMNDWKYGTWPADNVTSKNSALKALPAGGVASSWELPATPNSDGNSYMAKVNFLDSLVGLGDGPTFSVNIEPWSWKCSTYRSCDYIGSPYGPRSVKFLENTEIRITIRVNFLSDRIGKWAIGRIKKPSISLQNEKLVIEGSMVSYPMGYALLKSREECAVKLSSALKTYYPLAGNLCLESRASAISSDASDNAALSYFEATGDQVIENAKIQEWSLTTIPIKNFSSECFKSNKFSMASSDAMLYSNLPPVWDSSEGTLSYRIASTHVDSNGELNKGNYSLAIPKPVADCLWKFDVSKGMASIVITNPNGNQNVAITSLRTSNDWVYFDASGFTFSSPEIKVKFSKSSSVKMIEIICVKGKNTKKVVGANPKCPAGFKKK